MYPQLHIVIEIDSCEKNDELSFCLLDAEQDFTKLQHDENVG